ncbi:MAG TPA: ABC transporter permease [Acidimicrobiia bacterium]|nr:ABC transporter permease [Acidimicrobiia bacterium]
MTDPMLSPKGPPKPPAVRGAANTARRIVLAAAAPVIAIVFALALSAIVLLVSGSDPLEAYWAMLRNGGRLETIVDMLNRATPFYLSGLAAAIGFRMNLFNIGVEGQYQLAGFFAAVVGANVVLPGILHVSLIMIVAMLVGAIWSGLAGWLKVARGINEVISTIMLNLIAISGILAWLTVELRDGPLTPNSGTKYIPESGWLPDLNGVFEIFTREIVGGRRISSMLIAAIVAGVIYHVFLNRTRLGFDLRSTGYNPGAARAGGVRADRMVVMAMVYSGLMAGLVGMVDILSRNHRYDAEFLPGLGFAGIGVALLGRNHAVGVAIGAMLFAFMDVSSPILQITGAATREIVVIMQGIILLAAVVAYESVRRYRERDEAKRAAAELDASAVAA